MMINSNVANNGSFHDGWFISMTKFWIEAAKKTIQTWINPLNKSKLRYGDNRILSPKSLYIWAKYDYCARFYFFKKKTFTFIGYRNFTFLSKQDTKQNENDS